VAASHRPNVIPSVHQLGANDVLAADGASRYVFMTERRAHDSMTAAAVQGAEAPARRGRQISFAPI